MGPVLDPGGFIGRNLGRIFFAPSVLYVICVVQYPLFSLLCINLNNEYNTIQAYFTCKWPYLAHNSRATVSFLNSGNMKQITATIKFTTTIMVENTANIFFMFI